MGQKGVGAKVETLSGCGESSLLDFRQLAFLCLRVIAAIQEKRGDWTEFLVGDLTGSRTAPENLLEGVSVSANVCPCHREKIVKPPFLKSEPQKPKLK